MNVLLPLLAPLGLIACGLGAGSSTPSGGSAPPGDTQAEVADSAATWTVQIEATLDGAATAGIDVYQGGVGLIGTTDALGQVEVTLDAAIDGEIGVILSHPDARCEGDELRSAPEGPLVFALERFSTFDNTNYEFQAPGAPGDAETTDYCGHCHTTILEDWYGSPHRQAASNPRVHDLYAGAAAALADLDTCTDAGGTWAIGPEPGTGGTTERCYIGDGVLPDLNPSLCGDGPCDGSPTETGACADCHAPGIDGELGGRDLHDAVGVAYDAGVHCDVCHKSEAIDLAAPAGAAGRLGLIRPSEESPSPLLGEFSPLTFGPYPDVANPRMGSVPRPHYQDATFCAACHQLDQEALAAGIDLSRWPDGLLPVQSTYAEWEEGPLNPGAPCQSCHMPPDPLVGNSADLGNIITTVDPGIAAGWYREPGAVRRHVWFGPRSEEQPMLPLAASLGLETSLVDGAFAVAATVANVGPGHALPTGEPMRHLIVRVDAWCGDTRLAPNGGDVVPDYAGQAEERDAGADWDLWPAAAPGDVLVVLQRTGEWRDYAGPLVFGDGSFTPEQRGIAVEALVGLRTVLAVGADGSLTLDADLPAGDLVRRLGGDTMPADGDPASAMAGLPGWGFARVLADAEGRRMVPHFRAVDVVSDNRLSPQQSWTSQHRFAATCAEPQAHAVLLYRDAPLALAAERGWTLDERVISEAWR